MRAGPDADPLGRNAQLRRLSVAAVLAAALVLSFFQVTNLDIGGHLAVGRFILKCRSIPNTDFLTHTVRGHPYPVHQWLGEAVLFAVDHLTGVRGLILLRMLAVLLGAILLYRNARRTGAPVVVASAIVLLLVVAARPRFFVRPFLVSWVFLPLLHSWVADVRQGRTRRLWPVPVLLAVWGHVHSGVLFGILYLGGTLAGESGKVLLARAARGGGGSGRRRAPPGREPLDGWNLRRLALFSALAAVLPFATMALVNPSGLRPLLFPLLFLKHSALRAMIAEYRPVDLRVDWPFDLVGGALLLGVLLRPKKVDLTDFLIATGFTFLACRAVRGILPMAAVAAPLLAQTWGSLGADLLAALGGGGARSGPRLGRANAAEAAAILVVVAASLLVSWKAWRGWAFPFGFGKDPRHYPERALDFIQAQNMRGPLFNTDLWASSILWRWRATNHPVFVDARLEAYPETFWRETYYRVLRAAPGWREVLRRYHVQFAILRRAGGEADERIGEVLWEDPGWGLAYWDDFVMIFIRRPSQSPRNRAVLAAWEFTSFHPRRPWAVRTLRGEALRKAAAELERLTGWAAGSFLPRWALAAAWTRLGRAGEAISLFEELAARREARGNASFLASWAEAELVAGHRERWRELLQRAGRDPAEAAELFEAAALLARAGKPEFAEEFYRAVLRAAPGNDDARNNLALLLAQREEAIPEALELIEGALERAPADPYYLATRAEIRFRAGEKRAALEDFRKALELLPQEDEQAREEVAGWLRRLR